MTDKKLKNGKKASYRSKPCVLNHDDRGKALLDDEDESEEMPMKHIRCFALHQQDSPKSGESSSWRSYRQWRQERYNKSARLEKQLKVLEDQIDKQVKRFKTQYSRALNPTRPKDVAKLLAPSSTPPLELATLSWLGDWRPSSILGLLSSLTKSSPTLASSLTHAGATEKAISQLIHDLRIEEATVVKKILCQSDAAEFLVAFSGIQETVHQFSRDYKLRKGPVCVPLTSGSENVGADSAT
ncbi:hypothetical protein E3N88_39535 [Mikania micrantha]|uniref:DOG1 domain-containing protein n=1 Tax=Mikania micrantha TaxID=192012 RepID=A0A5N6LX30_9ASTR|nr:hypothetical protein E3N88_39535 [Mikania micrantha]